MVTIVAETDRLLLRRVIPDDFDDLAALFADPDVMLYSPNGPLGADEVRAWLDRNLDSYASWGLGMYVVVLKDDGFAGVCGINRFDDVEGELEFEIGFRTAKRHWNRGITTEAASAVRDHGFGDLGLERLVSLVNPRNVPSVRVAEKVGMSFEKPVRFLGMDIHCYAIHRDAWLTAQASRSNPISRSVKACDLTDERSGP